MTTLALWLTIAPAAAAALTLIWRLLRGVHRIVGKMDEFIDDWRGEPARPGVPARLGVMDRLYRIEHEFTSNSGASMRDAVDRIEEQLSSPQ